MAGFIEPGAKLHLVFLNVELPLPLNDSEHCCSSIRAWLQFMADVVCAKGRVISFATPTHFQPPTPTSRPPVCAAL